MNVVRMLSVLVLLGSPVAAEDTPPPGSMAVPAAEPEATGTVSRAPAAERPQREGRDGRPCLDVFFDPRSARELEVCSVPDE